MNVSGNMHSVSLSLEADAQSDRVIMPEVADETLIAGIGEGDRDALSVLFRRYAGLVRGIALRILRDKSDAGFVSVHSPQARRFDGSRCAAITHAMTSSLNYAPFRPRVS